MHSTLLLHSNSFANFLITARKLAIAYLRSKAGKQGQESATRPVDLSSGPHHEVAYSSPRPHVPGMAEAGGRLVGDDRAPNRHDMIARGRLTPAEYQRMVIKKTALAPWHKRATANARRLRRDPEQRSRVPMRRISRSDVVGSDRGGRIGLQGL